VIKLLDRVVVTRDILGTTRDTVVVTRDKASRDTVVVNKDM